MSVTLSVRNAPSHIEKVECFCTQDGVAEVGCFYCNGTAVRDEEVSDGVQPLNMSNMNAGAVLSLLGFHGEAIYGGEIETADIPAIRHKILILRNAEWARSTAVRSPFEERGAARATVNADGMATISTGPRVISCGIDDEYVLEKLERIDALLAEAQKLSSSVTWS